MSKYSHVPCLNFLLISADALHVEIAASLYRISKRLTLLCILVLILPSNIVSAQVPRPTPTVEQPRPVLDPVRARGRAVQQQVIVERAVESFTSAPLRNLTPVQPQPELRQEEEQPEPRFDPQRAKGKRREDPDKTLQLSPGPLAVVQVGVNFDGIPTGGRPPDPTGAAGETQYVQAVNSSFAVFDKRSGQALYGPAAISTLWTGVDSPCARHNRGDPIVMYDRIARRWLISQFLLNEQFGECIAISATEDATGPYHLYRFSYPNFPDYPKFGVWPDAYYVSYNMFGGPTGGRACALEREKMLRGASDARQVCFQTTLYSLLPSDFDGRELPPTGSPNFFLRRSGDGTSLALRKFRVDWTNPSNSTFGVGAAHEPDAIIPVEPFNDSCGEDPRTACVPQPNGQVLESLGERLMFRVAYRRFPDREVLVANHTIEPAGNPSRGAIRWYEIRNPNGTPTLFQQGTFLPDTRSRWMGSIGMDASGNIVVGYSLSGPDISPGIRIAARAANDPPGVLGGETVIVDGQSQSGLARWGDYSQMSIDPVDDCTFWFTAEYVSGGRRVARFASFRVNNCSGGGGGGGGGAASGRIVFVSNRDGNREIYIMNPDGGGQTRLTNNPADDYDPAWSPDGHKIVFVSNRDGNPEIYVMNANGGEQTRLSNNSGADEKPMWGPSSSSTPIPTPTPPGTGNFRIHRHENTPLSDERADQILADGLQVLGVDDDGAASEDVSCPVDLRLDGRVRTFNIGDGNVNTQAEKNAIFASEGHVYAVTGLSVCGDDFNASIVGCSGTGLPLIVELMDAPQQQDGILWMHEYGHNRGRGHRPRTESLPHIFAVMYPSISPRRRQVSRAECDAFQVPINSPLSITQRQEQPAGLIRPALASGAQANQTYVREFVRQLYPEGIPYEQARRLPPGAIGVLVEMLGDQREALYWTNIVTTLGMIGSAEAVEPLILFLEAGWRTEAPRLAEFQAKLAVPPALGYILERRLDGRVLTYLREGLDPAMWARRISWGAPEGVTNRERDIQLAEMTIWGLALSGRREAGTALNNLRARMASERSKYGEGTEQVLSEALGAHAVIRRRGLAAYYAR